MTNYNAIKQLARCHDVSLLTIVDSKEELQYVPAMGKLCTNVTCVLREQKSMRRFKRALGLLSRTPRSIFTSRSGEMFEAVARKTSENKFDCAVADATTMLEYLVQTKGFPKIVFHHNVDSVVMGRDYMMQHSRARRFRRWFTWKKAAAYERRMSELADAHIMVSEVDKHELLALSSKTGPIEVVGNGVDIDCFRVDGVRRYRNSIIFSSLLKYQANRNGLRWFCHEVFPEIKQRWKEVLLNVTGRFSGLGVDDLRAESSIVFTGYLDDIKPAVASSWLSIAPIHVGSGTRLKILEAMALGTPVVSTSVGAEGLDVEHERDILIADDPSDFARQILRLRDDSQLWQRLSKNGRRLVEERYDWKVLGKRFESFLHRVCREFSQTEHGQKPTRRL